MENEQPGEDKTGRTTEQVTDALRHVWWAGLGLVAVAGEEGERLLKTLVDKGKEIEPTVSEQTKRAADEMGSRLKVVAEAIGRGAGKAEVFMDEAVTGAMSRMGFPSKDEIRSLHQKIDELTARIEELKRQQTPPTY